jgi:hypothetical protein
VGDQRCREDHAEVLRLGSVSPQGTKGPDEAAPGIHLPEQVLDPDPRQVGLDRPSQFPHARGDLQGIGAFQVQTPVADGGERIVAEPLFRPLRHLLEFPGQTLQHPLGLARQGQSRVGVFASFGPLALVAKQVPERDMASALGQVQVARTQCIADGQGQGDLPDAAIDRPVVPPQGRAPGGRDEPDRGLLGQFLPLPGIEGPRQGQPLLERSGPRLPLEGQVEEGRKVAAEISVAGAHLIDVAALFKALELAAIIPGPAKRSAIDPTVQHLEEGLARLLGVHQDLDRSQEGLQALLDVAAGLPVPCLERVPRPPAQGRQELVVHRDHLIQEGPLGLHQEAGYQSVPLGRREPLEVIGVVAPGHLRQLLDEDWAGAGQVDPADPQGTEAVPPLEVVEDRRGVRLGWVLLEREQARPPITFGHLDKVVKRVAHLRRQPAGDALNDLVAAAGCDRGHDPFEGHGRW